MFVADTAGDMSAGHLYAVRWYQTSASNGATADLGWVPLGHATFDDVKAAIDSGITFSDIFETAEIDPNNPMVPRGFVSINTEAGNELLKVRPGMEKIASRLETRRYAAMMGASTEFRKEEGITYDPDHNKLYLAMSEVARGMEDFKKNGSDNPSYDTGGWNDIRVDEYIDGGAVYALDLGVSEEIGSEYVPVNMYGIVRSYMGNYDPNHVYARNKHAVSSISNPDNVTYIPGYNTLIIGEDTGSGHQNDFIWAFNVETEQLTRIQTTPYGSETTSPYWYPNINGFAYLMSVIQHPFGESDEDMLVDPAEAMGYTGYIGPFPAMD
jgi:secreted PhoX family phosphatase